MRLDRDTRQNLLLKEAKRRGDAPRRRPVRAARGRVPVLDGGKPQGPALGRRRPARRSFPPLNGSRTRGLGDAPEQLEPGPGAGAGRPGREGGDELGGGRERGRERRARPVLPGTRAPVLEGRRVGAQARGRALGAAAEIDAAAA